MGRHGAWGAWALAAFLAASLPPAAHGKPRDPTTAQARALANEGADLLESKQYAEALDRLTRAEDMHHAPTHLALIGQAQEGLGKLTAAAGTYERLVAEPLPRSAPKAFLDAQETGRERLRALLARVPSLLVTVHGLAPGEDAEAHVDGEPFDLKSATAVRVDPGTHVVRVTSQGYTPFERSIELPEKGGVTVVDAQLEHPAGETATAQPVPPSTTTPPSPSTSSSTPPTTSKSTSKSTVPPPPTPSLVPAFVAFGVGAVGLGVGAVTGILSLSKVSDLRSQCPGNRCTPAQQSEIDSAKTLGTISTIGFAVGAAGAAAGVVLLVWRPGSGRSDAPKAATVEPWIGAGAGGLRGHF